MYTVHSCTVSLCLIKHTSSLRATNKADKFSAWARCASNLSSKDDNTQKRMSGSAAKTVAKNYVHIQKHRLKPT